MALITVNTNIPIPPGGVLNYRWRKVSGGSWSAYAQTTVTPYSFSIPYPLGTNIEIHQYLDCKPGVSNTNSYTTNFTCNCNISNLYNLVVGTCNNLDNTYSITFDVDYTCMRNDLNVITSVFRVDINGAIYYVNPNAASGTQTITITGLVSDGNAKTLNVTCINA